MLSPEEPILGIVVVVYKSRADTVAFVCRQLPQIGCPFRAVVVDLDCAPDATRQMAAECGAEPYGGEPNPRQPVLFLNSPENLGYARGNNLGAELLLRHFPGIRWLLFSNNDIEIPGPETLSQLITQLQRLPDVACIGPRVLGLDGQDQSPLYEPIPLAEVTCMELFSPPVCRLFMPRPRRPGPPGPPREGYCYTVMGCFLLVRAEDFVAAGRFDPGTFLYREEEILSERLLRLRKRAYFLPSAVVRHHGGKTISRYIDYGQVNRLHFESTCYYYRNYRQANDLQIALLRFAKRVSLTRARLLSRFRRRPAATPRAAPAAAAPGDARVSVPRSPGSETSGKAGRP